MTLHRQLVLSKTVGTATILIVLSAILGFAIARLSPGQVLLLLVGLLAVVASIAAISTGGLRRLTLAAFAGFAALLPMTGLRLSESLSIADVFLVTAAVMLLPSMFGGLNAIYEPPFRFLVTGSACILIGAALGSFFSVVVIESFTRLLKFSLAALVLPILICVFSPTYQEIKLLALTYVGGSVLNCIVALVEPLHSYNQRADGLSNHFNTLGLTSVVALGIPFVYAIVARGTMRLMGIAAFVVLVLGIVQSGSRAAGIGAAVVCITTLWLISKTKWSVLLLSATFLLSAAAYSARLPISSSGPLARLVGLRATDVQLSDSGRVALLRQTLNDILQDPILGGGLLNARAAHNLYLQAWQASGLLGLVGIALVLYASVILPSTRVRSVRPNFTREGLLLAGLTAGLLGFFVSDLFQNAFWERYMWFVPSLTVALERLMSQDDALDLPLKEKKKLTSVTRRRPHNENRGAAWQNY